LIRQLDIQLDDLVSVEAIGMQPMVPFRLWGIAGRVRSRLTGVSPVDPDFNRAVGLVFNPDSGGSVAGRRKREKDAARKQN
jgi:hypothetical protein